MFCYFLGVISYDKFVTNYDRIRGTGTVLCWSGWASKVARLLGGDMASNFSGMWTPIGIEVWSSRRSLPKKKNGSSCRSVPIPLNVTNGVSRIPALFL